MPFEPKQFIEDAVAQIKRTVRIGKTIIAVSGGVDSTVTAVLMNEALGKKCVAVFVDTGFMRKGEPESMRELAGRINMNLRFIDAKKKFYSSLKGVKEPERKRKIIGGLFIKTFEKIAKEEKAKFLGQGTLAPDWIESGTGMRATIKSHHNVGGLPSGMKLRLVEPVRELYKDEVRKVGKELGLPDNICNRQPFPGPGLAIRIVGEATPEKVEVVREACAIVEEELEQAAARGEMELPWQYFAVLLPSRSVGVLGDKRAYGYTVAVRAVYSVDGMTAQYARIPDNILESISNRITRELKEDVNRVVYDITSKPPACIEWE
ncbi:glutamine-hydrolyzing GMP synthase subunit GuaA [Candidatus Micrarchaeota archaeon]|nr:glutamine-hydrolyzing GMP synthase subunit GuaA [Candidatus Micrarchaeota archaeon]